MVLGRLNVNTTKKIYSILKDSGISHCKKTMIKAHPHNQPQQTQISTYRGNIEKFRYNPVTK